MDLVVRHGEREEEVRLERTEAGYRVTVGEKTYEVDVAHVNDHLKSLLIDGRQHEVSVHHDGDGRYRVASGSGVTVLELMDPLTHLARETRGDLGPGGREAVTALMPGRVVKVLVEEGAEVEAGEGIVVVEAMKMENEIVTDHAGKVVKLHVAEGEAVEGGDVLFEVE